MPRSSSTATWTVLLDGRDVSDEIRGPVVTAAVSTGLGPPGRCGRCWSPASGRGSTEHGGGVVEGRDIGTVVFPDAPVKVFLTASTRSGPAGARATRPRPTAPPRPTRCERRWPAATSSTPAGRRRRCAPPTTPWWSTRPARRPTSGRRDRRPVPGATGADSRDGPTSASGLLPGVPGARAHAAASSCSGSQVLGQARTSRARARTSSPRRTARTSTSRSRRSSRRRRVRFMAKQELF